MAISRIEIQKIKEGNYMLVEGEPCIVKNTEKSKSGKHGHAKLRITCVGVFSDRKHSLTIPSGENVEVPEINKANASISFIEDNAINIMDSTTFESITVPWPKDEKMVEKLKVLQADPAKMSTAQCEYWKLMDKYLINRIYGD